MDTLHLSMYFFFFFLFLHFTHLLNSHTSITYSNMGKIEEILKERYSLDKERPVEKQLASLDDTQTNVYLSYSSFVPLSPHSSYFFLFHRRSKRLKKNGGKKKEKLNMMIIQY